MLAAAWLAAARVQVAAAIAAVLVAVTMTAGVDSPAWEELLVDLAAGAPASAVMTAAESAKRLGFVWALH